MKKYNRILLSLVLCVLMFALTPTQVMAAAENNKPVYVSEVKVGMGQTSEEAAAELIAEGYTILKDDDGSYSDLNYEAGTKSGMRYGPSQKIVYLGYKTTKNPKEAITDLAVMNMNGGYSIEEYTVLMTKHMDGEIKPFVDRFIAALNEYRENYNKPEDSLGHKRADYYRQMLNKLTDDDTGGQPLGDLLLNETKYEMGDAAYNALSATEKNNHADILTLLMQANGRAVLLIETLVTKAADSSDDTWLDRFLNTTIDDLMDEVKRENPFLNTEADYIAELDKKYNDTARKILEKWDSFAEIIYSYDDTVNELLNAKTKDYTELQKNLDEMDTDNLNEKDVNTICDAVTTNTDSMVKVMKTENIAIVEFLDETDYDYGTLLEFFDRDKSELLGEDIRELYTMAAALSPGQIAGLDFLSIKDLLTVAITDAEGYESLEIDDMEPASVYQDVDRSIYQPGGVALTSAALRDTAMKEDNDSDFMLSPLGFVFWGLTGITGIATLTTAILSYSFSKISNSALNFFLKGFDIYVTASSKLIPAQMSIALGVNPLYNGMVLTNAKRQIDIACEYSAFDFGKFSEYSTKATVCKYLAAGFAVITAVLSAVSIYMTVTEMLEYYNVTFTPIPKYMVDRADITEYVNGKEVMKKNETAYYKVVTCNRKEGESDTEKENYSILGNANDLNGDVGKQWLALYSVRYENGRPILADSFKVVKGNAKLPGGYETGIHRFGESAAFNLTHKYYCFNDTPGGTYVYYKNTDESVATLMSGESAAATGSMFSGGTIAISAVLGMLAGGGIVALIMTAKNKKKEQPAAV